MGLCVEIYIMYLNFDPAMQHATNLSIYFLFDTTSVEDFTNLRRNPEIVNSYDGKKKHNSWTELRHILQIPEFS